MAGFLIVVLDFFFVFYYEIFTPTNLLASSQQSRGTPAACADCPACIVYGFPSLHSFIFISLGTGAL